MGAEKERACIIFGVFFLIQAEDQKLRPTSAVSKCFILTQSLTDLCVFPAVGENVKEFFFRVASLAFETNVLAELEKSGSRQIGDVVSEYLNKPLCNHTI